MPDMHPANCLDLFSCPTQIWCFSEGGFEKSRTCNLAVIRYTNDGGTSVVSKIRVFWIHFIPLNPPRFSRERESHWQLWWSAVAVVGLPPERTSFWAFYFLFRYISIIFVSFSTFFEQQIFFAK